MQEGLKDYLRKARAFVTTYTPDLPRADEKYAVNSRTLFFHDPNLSFTHGEAMAALADYLDWIDAGVIAAEAFIAQAAPPLDLNRYGDVRSVIRGITRSWDCMEASELICIYLFYAPPNPEFANFVRENRALQRIERFMRAVDPYHLHPGLDVYKRVFEVYESIQSKMPRGGT